MGFITDHYTDHSERAMVSVRALQALVEGCMIFIFQQLQQLPVWRWKGGFFHRVSVALLLANGNQPNNVENRYITETVFKSLKRMFFVRTKTGLTTLNF